MRVCDWCLSDEGLGQMALTTREILPPNLLMRNDGREADLLWEAELCIECRASAAVAMTDIQRIKAAERNRLQVVKPRPPKRAVTAEQTG